ncbi:GNAT family N-acetyltransferase [Paenibacillus sp. YPG26]|nr:GNAT family N-acetyltransferase [Paenibacillus sp. YPG26]
MVISVASSWRGKGIGKELLKQGIEWARTREGDLLVLQL